MVKPTPEQIESWVISNFPDHKTRKNGSELVINNPLVYDDGYHFNIALDDGGACHDWRGDAQWVGYDKHGKVRKCTFIRFVQLYKRISYSEACKLITGIYAIPKKRDEIEQTVQSLELPKHSEYLATATGGLAIGARAWLHSRCISDSMIKRYNIMIAISDVVWPYYEFDDLVYWQSRSMLNKSFNFPPISVGVGKSDFLYGFDNVNQGTTLTIVEAIFSAFTLGGSTVATGGASLGPSQVKKVQFLNPVDGIILAPDNDKAGLSSILSNMLPLNRFKLFYSIPNKIVNGVKIKDWNELFTDAKLSKREVLDMFKDNIKPLDIQNKFKIMDELKNIDKLNVETVY